MLLTLKMEDRGYKPRNAGSLEKLEKPIKWMIS